MNRNQRARRLLRDLEVRPLLPVPSDPGESNAAAWARSGALALTGPREHPVLPAAPVPHAFEAALLALRALVPGGDLEGLDAGLLGERAAIAGWKRRGSVSCGGSCRIVSTRDGWIAPNLARDSDWELAPAWLEAPVALGDWDELARLTRGRDTATCLERGLLIGLPIGHAVEGRARGWCRGLSAGTATEGAPGDEARESFSPWVLDLTSLWAGPLCGDLLRRCGARVTKVESLDRPDGARRGPAVFYDLMNEDKESVAFDFTDPGGRRSLARLIDRADIVLESTRPRALAQLGVDAPSWLAARPGRVWCSITGYGRDDPQGGWVAFGDDAAVSGGLITGNRREPLFVGDAIADPLTGAHAAVAVAGSWRKGGGDLLDVALAEVSRSVAAEAEVEPWRTVGPEEIESGGEILTIRSPQHRSPRGPARRLGADTAQIDLQGCVSPG